MSGGGLIPSGFQLWYIEGDGDSEERGINAYGLGHAITDLEQVRPGDFLSYSPTPAGGHSVIFIDSFWPGKPRFTVRVPDVARLLRKRLRPESG